MCRWMDSKVGVRCMHDEKTVVVVYVMVKGERSGTGGGWMSVGWMTNKEICCGSVGRLKRERRMMDQRQNQNALYPNRPRRHRKTGRTGPRVRAQTVGRIHPGGRPDLTPPPFLLRVKGPGRQALFTPLGQVTLTLGRSGLATLLRVCDRRWDPKRRGPFLTFVTVRLF